MAGVRLAVATPVAFAEAGKVGIGQTGGAVAHLQPPSVGCLLQRGLHRRIGIAVFHRVEQQVGGDALQHAGVADHPGLDRKQQAQAPGLPLLAAAARQLAQQRRQVQRIDLRRLLPGFETGQRQQRFDPALHARIDIANAVQRLPQALDIVPTLRQLGDRGDLGHRGAQLVGHAARQPTLAFGHAP